MRDVKLFNRDCDALEAFLSLLVAKLAWPVYRHYTLEIDTCFEDEFEVRREVIKSADLRGVHKLLLSRLRRFQQAQEHVAMPGEVCRFCPLRSECQPAQIVDLDADQLEL